MRPRDNPFRSACIERVHYRFPEGLSWPHLVQRLENLRNRAALVGPQGSGKTTLLEELHEKMLELGYRARLLRTQPGFLSRIPAQPITKDDFLLLDSAERLSWIEWQQFKWAVRRAAGLVITSHCSGWLPTLLECRTTPKLFEQIVRELIGEDLDGLARESISETFMAHGGNIRAALRALYDFVADAHLSHRVFPSQAESGVSNLLATADQSLGAPK